MTDQQRKIYGRMYDELVPLAEKLRPYYSIDKIKSFGIYVWGTSAMDEEANIFDIYADEIKIWVPCSVHPDSLPIIAEIIQHLKKMEKYRKECER